MKWVRPATKLPIVMKGILTAEDAKLAAKTLGVAYVLDGSVRKSGTRLRVAARLIRPDNGYIVWSETYDRPRDDDDILMVQDDIAGEVTKALRASIDTRPDHESQ